MDYSTPYRCDKCEEVFDEGDGQRWWCGSCLRVYDVCTDCVAELNEIICPHCGLPTRYERDCN